MNNYDRPFYSCFSLQTCRTSSRDTQNCRSVYQPPHWSPNAWISSKVREQRREISDSVIGWTKSLFPQQCNTTWIPKHIIYLPKPLVLGFPFIVTDIICSSTDSTVPISNDPSYPLIQKHVPNASPHIRRLSAHKKHLHNRLCLRSLAHRQMCQRRESTH